MSTEEVNQRLEPMPSVIVEKPEGFVLDFDKFKETLLDLSTTEEMSMLDLLHKGINYSQIEKFTPERIDVGEIVGTFQERNWSGLVKDMGQPVSTRRPSAEEVYKYANHILEMDQEDLDSFIKGIDMSMYEPPEGGRKFFVDGDGRHRIMTLKALSKLGCNISITNMPVTVLGPRE